MKSLKTVISLFVLAVWSVALVHCKLETLPGLDFLRCATDAETRSDCQTDDCQTVESATYKVPDQQKILSKPIFSPLILTIVLRQEDFGKCLSEEISSSPPELVPSWRFRSRVAPPSRAPSFVS